MNILSHRMNFQTLNNKKMKRKLISFLMILTITVTNVFAAGEKNMSENENARLEYFFNKIRSGESVTVVALGGSITTGYAANPISVKSWAGITGQWLKDLAEKNGSKLSYYNRGLSGTDSAFAVARLEEHVLALSPDLVIVEYAMNDQWLDGKVRQRTYETIIRKIMNDSDTAVLALFVNERKPPYSSNQIEQQKICDYYNIPYVSWKDSLFDENPSASFEEYFDGEETVHPNNNGHAKIASIIISKLTDIWSSLPDKNDIALPEKQLPAAMNDCLFEKIEYLHMDNIDPIENTGWTKGSPVHPEWVAHGKVHKGWESKNAGAEIVFEVEGSSVGITYCESDMFRDAVAWVEKEDGSITQKIPLPCYSSLRKGYYGWGYRELLKSDNPQKLTVHIQCSKRAPKSSEGKNCNITGILVTK